MALFGWRGAVGGCNLGSVFTVSNELKSSSVGESGSGNGTSLPSLHESWNALL